MKVDVTALVFGLLILITGVVCLWSGLGRVPPGVLRIGLPIALVATGIIGIACTRQPSTKKRKDASHE